MPIREVEMLNFIKFDYLTMLRGDKGHNTKSAWIALSLSVLHLIGACYLLMEGVIGIAEYMNVNTFFVAVILAAAGTSVPDTVISIKSAINGDYNESIANAVGSNIFDITVCLGLPALIWTLKHGPIVIPPEANAAELRVILIGLTMAVMVLFVQRAVGYKTALTLLLGYVSYATYTICRGLEYGPVMSVAESINKLIGVQ